MSELGRYPIYFSVILAMLKYCHRLEGQQEGLLFDAYTVKPAHEVNSIKQSPVLKGHHFLVLS
jgi:hypothetical protein